MLGDGRLENAVFELVRRTACELPGDVVKALRQARDAELPGSGAKLTLDLFLQNVDMALAQMRPACQDTGLPIFFIHHPQSVSKRRITQVIHDVMIRVTQQQYLRPNAVDAVSGKNSGVNLGDGFPALHLDEWDEPAIEMHLILKGGGSENVGRQYSLPASELGAGRDLEGVRRVLLDAVRRAEGKGCPPGVLGVCIGGDRGSGYAESKRQLLRPLHDTNPDPLLAELETRVLEESNRLGIGPLGLGGRTTLLGVKIGALHRVPASFFVTVSYMCWVYRRRSLRIEADGTFQIF